MMIAPMIYAFSVVAATYIGVFLKVDGPQTVEHRILGFPFRDGTDAERPPLECPSTYSNNFEEQHSLPFDARYAKHNHFGKRRPGGEIKVPDFGGKGPSKGVPALNLLCSFDDFLGP